MTGPRLLRVDARVPRRWRNGGGVTHDVAVFPSGAGVDDFLWRASLATIAAAGPFSAFPGVDRALMLLTGELVIEIGGAVERLRPGAPALSFAGEDCVSAAPIGGPCTVLNIMTRRGAMSARLARWTAAQPTVAEALLLLAPEGATVMVGRETFDLTATDALLIDPAAGSAFSTDRPLIAAKLVSD